MMLLIEWLGAHRAVSAMEEDDGIVWRRKAMVHGGAVAIMEHLAIAFLPCGWPECGFRLRGSLQMGVH